MSTLTMASPSRTVAGPNYAQNVGRAARALLAALLARPARLPARVSKRRTDGERLFRFAAQYESVMPNLAQELRAIACRN